MGLCIGGGFVPTGTTTQYLAAFGYPASGYPLDDSVYQQIAVQDHPPKKSSGPGGQDNWVELAVACMKARAVLFCNGSPGDVPNSTAGSVLKIASSGLGITGGSLGLAGVDLTGALGTALGAATLGVGVALSVVLGFFQAHAQAEQIQSQVLSKICPAATASIQAIDNAVLTGQATPAQAIQALNSLYSSFQQAVSKYENDCNAFCWYDYIMKCHVDVAGYLYALPQYQPPGNHPVLIALSTGKSVPPVVASGAVAPSAQNSTNTTIGGFSTISENVLVAVIATIISALILGGRR